MGQKYVTVDGSNVIQETFDSDNNNVPIGAIEITDSELSLMHNSDYVFSDYEVAGGSVQLRASAPENLNIRIINDVNNPKAIRALIELLIDEINILRATQSLPDRTLAQFKTSMRNKLV